MLGLSFFPFLLNFENSCFKNYDSRNTGALFNSKCLNLFFSDFTQVWFVIVPDVTSVAHICLMHRSNVCSVYNSE